MSEQIAHVCTGVGNKVKPIPQESCFACVAGPNMTVDDLCRHIESFGGHIEFSNAIRDGMAIKIDLLERQLAEAASEKKQLLIDALFTASKIKALNRDLERVTQERDGARRALLLAKMSLEQGQNINGRIAANGPTIGEVIRNALLVVPQGAERERG